MKDLPRKELNFKREGCVFVPNGSDYFTGNRGSQHDSIFLLKIPGDECAFALLGSISRLNVSTPPAWSSRQCPALPHFPEEHAAILPCEKIASSKKNLCAANLVGYTACHFCPVKTAVLAGWNDYIFVVSFVVLRDRVFHIAGIDSVAPAWPGNACSGRSLT